MYELYVSLRVLLRFFFFSPSSPVAVDLAVLLAVFLAVFAPASLAGALDAVVEAGALLAVEAGCAALLLDHDAHTGPCYELTLGAIASKV